ncbi:MAG: prepilin peptidase [Hyphococcus sp.]
MYWVILATGGVLGLLAGSFLNVVIHRGPAMWKLVEDDSRRGDLARPRSYCPACGAQLRAYHLIPLISYIALGGRCASCKAAIPARYPIVEALAAAAGAAAVLIGGAPAPSAAAALYLWMLLALAAIDWETGYLPDALTLPLIVLGLAVNSAAMFAPLPDALVGAVAGFAVFWAVGAGFQSLRGIEGLGLGDAKLLAALGAWLGWQALAPVVLIASLVALAGVGVAVLRGGKVMRETALPFGPALAAAGAFGLAAQAFGWLPVAIGP